MKQDLIKKIIISAMFVLKHDKKHIIKKKKKNPIIAEA